MKILVSRNFGYIRFLICITEFCNEMTENKIIFLVTIIAVAMITLVMLMGDATASNNPNAANPSQTVSCNLVDKTLSQIPHGDSISPVTDAEVGPGGWRYSNGGGSFVTFAHTLNDNGSPADPSDDFYDVDAGRSNVAANAGTINDYPMNLDLPQSNLQGAMTFKGNRGEIVLTGDSTNDPPLFALPGKGEGKVRINLIDNDKDGKFEGCAKTNLLKNFGFLKPEGGDFVQREYFKGYAEVDSSGTVTFFEWTEISTFKNTSAGN